MKKTYRFLSLVLIAFALGCSSDDASVTEDGVNHAPNLKATGKSAHDFLSADSHDALEIEVLYVGDFSPAPQTLANLKQFLEARLNKPDGITITQRQIASPGNSPYNIDEIGELEAANRTKYNNVNVLTLCILFVDGQFETDTNTNFTLGTAYRNTSCVMYESSIRNLSSLANVSRVALETTVILHETGHLLGLVNLGSPMQNQHQDEAHGRHCSNHNCLMYWQTENSVMNGTPTTYILQLDANCLADLQANGGK